MDSIVWRSWRQLAVLPYKQCVGIQGDLKLRGYILLHTVYTSSKALHRWGPGFEPKGNIWMVFGCSFHVCMSFLSYSKNILKSNWRL